MFDAKRAFFSFTQVTDPAKHYDFNAWHMLDHRPENLALSGLIYGERFVNSPDCVQARLMADPQFAPINYVNLYWFREPLEQSLREFFDLGERTAQLGRRPDLSYTHRPFTGMFLPVKGYAHPRTLVSPEAIPFRPTRGLFLHLCDLLEPRSDDALDMLAWYDQVHIPDILECKGVAGAWTFASDPHYLPPGARTPAPEGRRIHLYFLDGDPLETVADIRAHTPVWRAAGRIRDNSRTKRDLYLGPFRTIIPWQWNWFD